LGQNIAQVQCYYKRGDIEDKSAIKNVLPEPEEGVKKEAGRRQGSFYKFINRTDIA